MRVPIQQIGWTVTIVWALFFSAYIWRAHASVFCLTPKELGDFLAGMFAPLVFVWIIVGYYQQAAELRLQVAELTQQVAATQRLASEAQISSQLEVERVQPIFVVEYTEPSEDGLHISLKNAGWPAACAPRGPIGRGS